MTEKEIVQALRACVSGEAEECPFTEKYGCDGCPKASADLIERLSDENAALREGKTWRRAMQEPPEVREDVALYVASKLFKACRAAGDTWFLKVSDDAYAALILHGGEGQKAHWMPLPGAPEEGES